MHPGPSLIPSAELLLPSIEWQLSPGLDAESSHSPGLVLQHTEHMPTFGGCVRSNPAGVLLRVCATASGELPLASAKPPTASANNCERRAKG